MPTSCRHLLIHGRVQGVGFRWALHAQASVLGLSGWVRNRRDGSVEALICGSREAIDTLTTWAWQGPPGARVERVLGNDEADLEDSAVPPAFERRPTF